MQIHSFKGQGRVFGFTRDDAGGNLPVAFGPWAAFKSFDLKRGDANANFDVNECLDDIETHGFHLTDAHVRATDRAVR
ncbi:MAG: hypothetical protein WBY53_14525 [Acidobacteriaceae bacterium]